MKVKKITFILSSIFAITFLIFALIVYVLPMFDFMYTHTAKYFLKGKTTEQDINEGGKRCIFCI